MSHDTIRPYFLLAILSGSALLVFFIFKPFLIPLALAAIFAVVLQPVYQYFLKRVRGYSAVAAGATILLGVICLVVPLSFLGSKVVAEAQQMVVVVSNGGAAAYINSVIAYAQDLITTYIPGSERFSTSLTTTSIDGYAKEALSWVVTHLGVVFSGVTQLILSFLIFLIALFFLLKDGAKLRDTLIHLSPLADREDTAVLARLERAVNSIVKGNLTLALIQAFLSGIGLVIFGVPNPILWGMLTGFAALIPGVGSALVLIPSAVFLLITGSTGAAIGLVLWAMLAVGLVDNLLGPRLVGKGAQLHPLIVFFSVLGGISLFGPAGIFLGPLCSSLLFALLTIYSDSSKT